MKLGTLYLASLLIISSALGGCTDSSEPCAKSWKMLKNPRLDVIADDLANLRAKIASGNGTQEDSQKVQLLQDEEKQIWKEATALCR
jgi:hypothetical protein